MTHEDGTLYAEDIVCGLKLMASSKRILIFSLAYVPFTGGAELAVKEITDRINQDEYEFDMITLRFDRALPRFERIGNVNVYRIGFSKLHTTPEELLRFPMYLTKVFFPISAFFKALSLNRTHDYDALWAIMAYAGFPVVMLKTLGSPTSKSFRDIQLILTLQEGDTVEHMTRRLRIRLVMPLYKMVFRKAAAIQAISNYLAGFARSMGATCPIEVIPNGADIEKYRVYNTQHTETLRKELAIRLSERIIITTSRLVPKNGIDTLIDAMKYLPEDVKLLVLGDGPLKQHYESKITSQELGARVFMLGHIPSHEISDYLHIADVFCRPSRSEGMGSSFIEAMAAGVPLVATPVGGIPDFLKDGETGLFCEVDNPKNVAEKIQLLFDNSALRAHIIQNARAMIEEKYDWAYIVFRMKRNILTFAEKMLN